MLDGLVFRHLGIDVLRLAFAALLVGACLPVGRMVRRAWGGRNEPLFDLGVGFGVVSALLRVLAFAGLATRTGVLVFAAIWIGAALVSQGVILSVGGGWVGSRRIFLGPLSSARRSFAAHPTTIHAQDDTLGSSTLGMTLALAIALPALVMALAPPVSFDELAYHLRIPEVVLHAGTWPLDAANSATFYPSATEALYLPALALDPSGITPKLIHFAFFVLLLIVLGRLGGVYAILLAGSVPALGIAGGWALADAPMLFLLACAALALREGERNDAMALLGTAAAVKYAALLFGLPLALAAIRRNALRGIAAGLLVAAPWYVTHPIAVSAANLQWDRSWLAYFTRPEGLDNDIGGPLLFLFGAVVLLALSRPALRGAAFIALAMVVAAMQFHPAGRVLLPAVVAVLVVAAQELAPQSDGVVTMSPRYQLGACLVALFVIRGLAIILGNNALFFNPAPAAFGLETEETYIARHAPLRAFYRRLALPPEANVLVVGEPRLFGFPARTSGAGLPDPPALRPFVAAGGGDLSQRLRAAGFTHLFVNLGPLNGGTTMTAHRLDIALTDDERRALDALMHASEPVARNGESWVLRLH